MEPEPTQVFRPNRAHHAAALACVLGLDESDAQAALERSLVWDEKRFTVSARLADGRTVQIRLDAERSGPAETWEALASNELIPPEWIDDPSRSFRGQEAWRVAVGPSFEPRTLSYPPTLRSCVTFASDANGVATAEVLAKETCERLRPWGATPVERIRWNVGLTAPELSALHPLRPRPSLAGPAPLAALDRLCREMPDPRSAKSMFEYPRWLTNLRGQWRELTETFRTLPSSELRYTDLYDPFEPLAGLYALGYGLSGLVDGTLELYAIEA